MQKNPGKNIVPHIQLKQLLAGVEKPGRYVGGEFGSIQEGPLADDLRICVVFPDLYEIGMSNQAVRILYKIFNDTPGLHGERSFSPAPDFRDGLKSLGLNLYSLETGIPLGDFDVIALTVGYELSFTNLLSILDSSGIPLCNKDRSDSDPLILAGGPAMTNPLPWADYIDGIFIGEAEDSIADIMLNLRERKTKGDDRSRLLDYISSVDTFWTADQPSAEKAYWPGFGSESELPPAFPVPSMIPVQDHGVIEIMRGCPNKCRFCHAGVFYRPYRQKSAERILSEAAFLVDKCGYRDITLSSLSTGDYKGLGKLVDTLNGIYSSRRVSFSLPSLRVNSITLSLIGSLGTVRKSGLTFAVETPTSNGQRGINKEVPADKVIDILKEAGREGWKLAKFYFMIGLPVDTGEDEALSIVDYLISVQKATGIKLNVNLGTFIPKPHTPFERSAQLTDEEAIERIRTIRDGLRSNKKIKFSFHSPYVSFLEGIISRGDRKAGLLALEAWKNGAEFDAWDDRMDKDAWRKAISAADWDVEKEICQSKEADENLPWDSVDLGLNERHFPKETERGRNGELTEPCAVICTDHCGVCDKETRSVDSDLSALDDYKKEAPGLKPTEVDTSREEPLWQRILLRFIKDGPAIYLGHLDIMNVFEKALQRSGLVIDFTQGFNPKPRIEFAQPLSLGIRSRGEVCTIRLAANNSLSIEDIICTINESMPEGVRIVSANWIAPPLEGRKTIKVMSAFWGADWSIDIGLPAPDTNPGTETPEENINLEKLGESLRSICSKNGIADDISVKKGAEGLSLRLKHGGTKNHNLMRMLEEALGRPALSAGLDIIRLDCLAKDSDSKPVSFESVFSVAAEPVNFSV